MKKTGTKVEKRKKFKKSEIGKKVKSCKVVPKVKTQVVDRETKRVLIVENIQNCFFKGGSMGFMSKGKKDEEELIKKINYLINLEEKSIKYKNAGLSGKKTKKGTLSKVSDNDNSLFETNSRKKYYYDIIVFSCTTNPPDHYIFASHHHLRNPNDYKLYVEKSKKKQNSFIDKNEFGGQNKIILLPDHALTDGSDFHMIGNKKLLGIDFHPDLDLSSLYRPFSGNHKSVFLNKQHYYNRGFIIHKGTTNKGCRSAFLNSDMKSTGLNEFLKCNNLEDLTICGMGREQSVCLTLLDSLKYKNIKLRTLISDGTRDLGIELPPDLYPKKVQKELEKNEEKNIEDSEFYKFLENKKINTINTDILINLTNSNDIFSKQQKMSDLKKSISSFENFFSQSNYTPPENNILAKENFKSKLF